MVAATSGWSWLFDRHNADDNIYNHKVAFERHLTPGTLQRDIK